MFAHKSEKQESEAQFVFLLRKLMVLISSDMPELLTTDVGCFDLQYLQPQRLCSSLCTFFVFREQS
jgi:hypothetical protein